MARTGRFALERPEPYRLAHRLHALCTRIERALPPGRQPPGTAHHVSRALHSIARSTTALTRRRAITETRAAGHAVEDALRALRVLARRQPVAAPAAGAGIELAERLLVLLGERVRSLRGTGSPGDRHGRPLSGLARGRHHAWADPGTSHALETAHVPPDDAVRDPPPRSRPDLREPGCRGR